MSIRQTLTLAALACCSLAPLHASAAPVAASEAFGDMRMGYWPGRLAGSALAPVSQRASLSAGYYYGGVLRPLTVWVSDGTASLHAPHSNGSATDSWRSGNRLFDRPRHGHGHDDRYFDDDGGGHHGHGHDDPGSNPSPVPLPASGWLLLSGAAALLARRSSLLTRARARA